MAKVIVEFRELGQLKTREFSDKVHGKNHKKLAEQFVEKHSDKGAHVVSGKSAEDEEETTE